MVPQIFEEKKEEKKKEKKKIARNYFGELCGENYI